jgi:hypothetical protein
VYLDQSWMKHGLCLRLPLDQVDELFFAEAGMKGSHAKKICRNCPVRLPCRDYGLVYPPAQLIGIWGGLNQEDRRYYHREVPELITEIRNRLGVQEQDFEEITESAQVDLLSSILQELGLTPLELPVGLDSIV